MNSFSDLLRYLATHLVQTAFAVFIGMSILRAIVQAAREDPAKRRAAAGPSARSPEAELRERVRAGFEEMMRRRAATQAQTQAQAQATPRRTAAPATPPARPQAARPQAARPQAPRPTPRTVHPDNAAPARPPAPIAAVTFQPSFAPMEARALRTAPVNRAMARENLARRQEAAALQSGAGRLLQDVASIRRALLTREILDAPLALRDPR